jgi:hypothetical protein
MSATHSERPPHAGEILSAYARRHGISRGRLAAELSLTSAGMHYRLHAPDTSVCTLWHTSRHLKHNFFTDLAATLPALDNDQPSEKEQRLQQQVDELQRALDALNIELNVYKNILKKA